MLEDEKDGMRLVIAETVEVLPRVPGRDGPKERVSMAGGAVDASSDVDSDHDTLADILYARAARDPDRDGFIFLNYGGGERTEERLTYANLLMRAKAVAAALQAHVKRGDRVLILCPPGPAYIAAFFGTVLTGMVAVPAYPPRNAKHMDRLRAIVADAEAAAVLAPEALHDRLTDWAGGLEALPPLVAVDRFTGDPRVTFRDVGVKPDDLAFLQYTSGTTGTPKGVMVSHAQVVTNLERICDLIAPRRTDTGCCWLPPYHDMGLIGGILFPLMTGLPIVLMPPAAFLQRPLRWLEAMSDYRAAITTAPNFAWQLCADAVDEETPARLDLTALRCGLSGAEKVRYETMEAFARKFAPHGFRRESIIPVYGMAETVLLATGTPRQTLAAALLLDPVALSAGRVNILERRVAGEAEPVLSGGGPAATAGHLAVSCGRVIAGHALRIVDPETRAECADDAVGEIWLSGPSLATGYWGRPGETAETFKARLADASVGPDYLRTGDLGTVVDGELYVLGRIKEMIIVRGRNHYAQDLEGTAASADPLLGHDRTIAFAIEGRSEEQMVLVHELTRSALRAFDAPAVAAAMRKAVVEAHDIAVAAIVFVKPASLPRTTSGKLQRGKARQLFQAGELAEVARWERPAAGEAMTVTVEPPHAASSPVGEENRLGAAPARILRHIDPEIAAATSRARADRMIAWLRAYAEDHINSRLIDERRTIPPYIVLDFARQGLMGPQIGLEHGGAALTFGDTLRLIEQLAAIDLCLALFVGLNHVLGTEPIRQGGSSALRDRVLPEIASGSSVAAFAVTEPGAGSNPRGMQAVAIRDGPGRWKLFGEKWWSGNASWANYISVFCKLQDEKGRVTGTAGFLVERGMPGLRQGPEALTMGVRGMVQNSIFLEGVSVDRDRMLGEEGDGLSLAMGCMRLGRLGIAAMCLGGMARCAQLMTRYAGRRVVGSGNLLDNPVTCERISRILSERLALACLVEHMSGRIDAGSPVAEDLFHAAKVAAPEFLWQAADDLVQTCGGRGYIETNGAAQLLRDARALRVFEGPTETVASYLGFRVLSDEGDLIAALRQMRPEDGGALPTLIALREEVRTRVDILSATKRSDLFLPMGEATTFALLTVLLDRTIDDLEATAEMAVREALARARMHMWSRFEAARRKVSIRGPGAESIDRAMLTELVAGLAARIGDVEQKLPGEAHDLDPLLRRDWDREAPDKATLAGQKGVPPQLAKRLARRVTVDAMIVDTIRSDVAAVVGAPRDAIEVDTDLTSLGIDSLAGAQLIDRLNRSFNVSLDASELYDYPTIRALASMLGADDDIVEEDCTPVAPAIGISLVKGFDEPVAIIGMSCRFPGAPDVESYWQLLSGGRHAIEVVPRERWNIEAYYDPDPDAAGKISTRFGGFIEAIDRFDAEFFRIAPVEANELDPQQRLLLETSWQALEAAGVDPGSLTGSRTGVYVGIGSEDYRQVLARCGEAAIGPYFGTGNSYATAAGRLSYVLGLQGPAVAVDTACSSSLVALDHACDALRLGKADLVLAAGVNALLAPEPSIFFSRARFLAPDGLCKTFDARADGYVRGEGCGVLVLKRLSDARRAGDRIWALLRGSAVNQDGASNGLTAPNGPAQQRVIGEALVRAGISPAEVDYLEAHGTGTALGDPIEVRAAATVYAAGRPADRPLLIGSVKTNIGHLEAAAGVAGVIKTVLALNHGLIPRHLNFEHPSPHIAWETLPVKVVAEPTAWPSIPERPRRAGVSSFGFSGTNAHVILEGYGTAGPTGSGPRHVEPVVWPAHLRASQGAEALAVCAGSVAARTSHLLPLSGKTSAALRAAAERYQGWLEAHGDVALEDVCFTAGVGRSHFGERAGLVLGDREQLLAGLAALAVGREAPGLVRGSSRGAPRLAFLFTGQGSQWAGMSQGLYETEPVFRAVLDRCDELILKERGCSLLDVMFGRAGAAGNIEDTAWTQPGLYALQAGLVALYRSVGISASLVMGHSVGEIGAAHAAGVFDLETGLRLSAGRGALMGSLPADGAMAAIFAPANRVKCALAAFEGLSLAADNGAHQVVSGVAADVARIEAMFTEQGVRVKRLRTSHAFHSALMDPMLDDLARLASGLTAHAAQLPLISNVTGVALGSEEVLDGAYWRSHARAPVWFGRGLAALCEAGVDLVVEIGPHPVLTPLALTAWPGKTAPKAVASLRRAANDAAAFARALADLYVAGARLDFSALHVGETRAKLPLPTYPFQRQRYWVETPKRRQAADAHPLLGERHTSARGEVTFESELSIEDQPWLSDHRVFERLVAPGALHGVLATAAWAELGGMGSVRASQVQLQAPLILEAEAGRMLQVVLPAPEDAGGVAGSFEVYSRGPDEEAWTLHAAGRIAGDAGGSTGNLDLADLRRRLARREAANIYDAFADNGVRLGPAFRVVSALWVAPGQALGEVVLAGVSSKGLLLHPTLLDGCFQVLAAALPEAELEGASYLPFGWERLWLAGPLPERVWCHGRLREADVGGAETRLGDFVLCDGEGRVLGGVDGFTWKRATRDALRPGRQRFPDWLYEMVWRERPFAGGLLPAAFLPEPAMLAASAPTAADLLRAEGVELSEIEAFVLDLERLARSYVVKAFDALGWRRKQGEQVEIEALRQRLKVVSPHGRLFARLLALLNEAGVLAAVKSRDGARRWRVALGATDVLPDAALNDPEALKAHLLAHYPFGRIELELLGRCGAALCDVLRGRADPLALLFAAEGASAADLYRMAPAARAYNSLVASIFAAMIAGLPQGRRLRVLEIGAGTGGTTAAVLPALPAERVDYVYTDLSAGFFVQAKARFGPDYRFVDYRVLDIERDPESQGFARHGYDVVLAANVLHATRDIGITLEHCRGLLAQDGLLVLLEGLRPQGWLDLTFGLLDGWWRFADAHRADSALLPGSGWRRVLAAVGFGSTVVLGAGESETGAQGVIVARGPSEVGETSGLWVIAADAGGAAEELAEALAARNQTVVIAESGSGPAPVVTEGAVLGAARRVRLDPTSREAWQAQLTCLSGETPLRGVVHLCGLDGHGMEARAAELAEDVRGTAASALALTQALLDLGLRPSVGLSFVTRGAQVVERETGDALAGAMLWGLGKTLALEAPQLQPRMLDLEPGAKGLPDGLIEGLLYPDCETHIAYRGRRLAGRLVRGAEASVRVPLPETRAWRIVRGADGRLDGLQTVSVGRPRLGPGEIRVRVEAAGLNFRDVLVAMNLYPEPDATLGGEFCGQVLSVGPDVGTIDVGDRVMGFAASFADETVTRADLATRAPENYSPVALATMPIVFATADLAFNLAGLKAGERLLIHAAAGGVGLAAIQLARLLGVEVYATASASKQAYLRSLGVKHVFDSRRTTFGAEILEATGGAGVDVVLNCLTSPGFIEASLTCLAQSGRFVEIEKRDIWSVQAMASARPDVAYHILAVDHLLRGEPQRLGAALGRTVERLRSGEITPVPATVWPMSEAPAAMAFMRAARHIGKIALIVPPSLRGLRSDRSYLITGGLGGIGLAVAGWLADRGAGHVVLNGRRPPDLETEAAIASLAARGVAVRVMLADVSRFEEVEAMLAEIDRDLPPLAGVVHSVGVLADGAVTNQSWDRFETVLAPKVLGAWHLHRLTQERDLDLFVLFSSMAGVLGNAGQSNHAAANAFLDQLARHRRSLGLPGQSIAWGRWSDLGEAEQQRGRITAQLQAAGIGWIDPAQGLKALGRLLDQDVTTSAVLPVDWSVFAARLPQVPALLEEVTRQSGLGKIVAAPSSASDLVRRLQAAEPDERRALLTTFISQELQGILGRAVPPDPTAALFDLGVDSLMAIQLANRLEAATGKAIPVRTLYEHPTIADLARVLEVALGQGGDPIQPVGRDGPLPVSFAQQRLGAPDLRSLIEGDLLKRRTTAAEILEDAQSADDMRPSDRRTPAGDFLVTGATGMVGTRVVQELLRRTSGKVYCLVRNGDERLSRALRSIGATTSLFGGRAIAVSSHLSRGHFDLDGDCYRDLATTVGTIVHCAADVDFVKPYRELRAVNVEAVRAILEFAATGTAKRVLYASSLSVLETPEKRGRSLSESELPANPLALANGYAQSKWAAEAMLMRARERGFEIAICRAPWLLDPVDVTQGRADGFIRGFIAGCLQMGYAPDSTMSLNLMPVDFIGKAIAALASDGATLDAVYHLGAERMLAIWELARLIRTPAAEVALEPFEAWTDRVEHRLARDEDFALKRYAPLFRRHDSGGSIITTYLRGDMPSMNSRHTHETLQAMGLTEIPSVDAMSGLIRSIAMAVRGDQAVTVVSWP